MPVGCLLFVLLMMFISLVITLKGSIFLIAVVLILAVIVWKKF